MPPRIQNKTAEMGFPGKGGIILEKRLRIWGRVQEARVRMARLLFQKGEKVVFERKAF